MGDQLILFTECINLNSEHCPYTEKPERILSILSDPEKFLPNESKIQELNNQCFDCAWYQKKNSGNKIVFHDFLIARTFRPRRKTLSPQGERHRRYYTVNAHAKLSSRAAAGNSKYK